MYYAIGVGQTGQEWRLTSVAIVDKGQEGLRVHVPEGDLFLGGFKDRRGEHGSKVVTGSAQHQAVGLDSAVPCKYKPCLQLS